MFLSDQRESKKIMQKNEKIRKKGLTNQTICAIIDTVVRDNAKSNNGEVA